MPSQSLPQSMGWEICSSNPSMKTFHDSLSLWESYRWGRLSPPKMITLITVCQGLHLTNHIRYQLHTLPHLILNKLLIMMNAHITDRADRSIPRRRDSRNHRDRRSRSRSRDYYYNMAFLSPSAKSIPSNRILLILLCMIVFSLLLSELHTYILC